MFRSRLRTSGLALAQSLRPSTTKTTSTASKFAAPLAARSIHHVPSLTHDFSEGVPNLMSPGGFNIAWSEYMALTVEKLNALTAGSLFTPRALPSLAQLTEASLAQLHADRKPTP